MKKLITSCTVAGLIIAIAFSTSFAGTVVGIDARNASDASFNLVTAARFSTFRATITGLGYTIAPEWSFNTADLVGLDLLILKQPVYQEYSSSEIAAIHAFVNSGGGLIVCGEGGGASDLHVSNLNQLVSPYGVVYSTAATEDTGYTISGFVSHSVTKGVSTIGVDYQRREMIITSPAIDLTIGSGANDALAAVDGFGGTGNVVLLSDTSLWVNEGTGSDRPITFGDNQLLLQNSVQFTIPEPASALIMLFGASLVAAKRKRGERK